jgi:predicted acetyltransferase
MNFAVQFTQFQHTAHHQGSVSRGYRNLAGIVMDELTRKHIKLVSPSLAFKQPYLELLEEQAQHGEDSFKSELPQEDFGAFLMELSDLVQGIDLPPGIVPMSTFWLVDSSSTILGKSVVRHALTPALEHHGGHIGYVIRP